MKVGIMQPYFFPYLGYFQLINAVDIFVIYDNIQYTKKGWINRNRYLKNANADYFTIPLKKASDYLNVVERYLADDFKREKMLNQLAFAYKKAPYFKDIYPILEECIMNSENNLFWFIYSAINEIIVYLDIKTKVIISSTIDINHNLKSVDKVIAICKALDAHTYINPIGGMCLYSKDDFKDNNLNLQFINMNNNIRYKQFNEAFVPSLSIIDVLMFNSKEQIKTMLSEYEIL